MSNTESRRQRRERIVAEIQRRRRVLIAAGLTPHEILLRSDAGRWINDRRARLLMDLAEVSETLNIQTELLRYLEFGVALEGDIAIDVLARYADLLWDSGPKPTFGRVNMIIMLANGSLKVDFIQPPADIVQLEAAMLVDLLSESLIK